MMLGELIKALERFPDQDFIVPVGFHHPHSYRGDYSHLAFEPKDRVKVRDMLASAKAALNQTFSGYKGGDYTMSEYANCHIAEYGSCGEEIGPIFLDYMLGNI